MPPPMHAQKYKERGLKPPPYTGVMRILSSSHLDEQAQDTHAYEVGPWSPLTLAFRIPHIVLGLSDSGWAKDEHVLVSPSSSSGSNAESDAQNENRLALITGIVGNSVHLKYEDGENEQVVMSSSDAQSRLTRAQTVEGKTATMLLDTGMGGGEAFQINIDRAKRLEGIDVWRLGRFMGQASPGPVTPGEKLAVEGFQIGNITIYDAEIEVTNANTDKLARSCGVCGISAFSGTRVVFDYKNARLRIERNRHNLSDNTAK